MRAKAAVIARHEHQVSPDDLRRCRIMGAEMRAQGAREAAKQAIRDANRAEAEAWSVRMEGYGGPAHPSPTIGECLNRGVWVAAVGGEPLQNPPGPAPRSIPPAPATPRPENTKGPEKPGFPPGARTPPRATYKTTPK